MDLLVVGLGNPGAEYEGTRHNIGADAVERLVARHHGSLSAEKGLHARAGQILVVGHKLLCATPLTYMNVDGLQSVVAGRAAADLDLHPAGGPGSMPVATKTPGVGWLPDWSSCTTSWTCPPAG
jgi:hypothetical protein